ncbi:MAG TPA: DUF4870 domain-containing protein [Candidatus Bilamarchaeum sp.]|nr:DUF4870 domain-containing protein [Candidatus Bilamarchaeum sp.]
MLSPARKDSNILAALSYALSLVVALIVYLIEKEDKWLKFHALQAMLFDLAYTAAFFVIFILGWIFAFVTFGLGVFCILPVFALIPLVFIYRLYLAYRAFKGEYFELPMIGQLVLKHV